MVGNSATRLACEFQRAEWRRHEANMKPQERRRSIAASSLRGLQGRSATGQNDQAAKEKMSRRAGYRENTSGFRLNGEVFFACHPLLS